CGVGDDRCGAALELHLVLPCCDAHDAYVWIEFADGSGSSTMLAYEQTMNAGSIDVTIPYPANVARGTATVTFYATGDGTESFDATGTVEIVPDACAHLDLSVRSQSGQPDAGP